jgi:hypothetical protein
MSEKTWTEYAKKQLEGRTITEVRYMTEEERENLGWYSRSVVLILDNGSLFFPAADDEGNDAGALFGQDSKGGDTTLPVL